MSCFVPVARALRGPHQVAFYTGSELQPELEPQGFRVFPFLKLDDRFSRLNPGIATTQKTGPRAQLRVWRNFLLGGMPGQLQDLERIVAEWRPDAIVCDMTMWGPILVLQETARVPVAVLAHIAYCIIPGRENPAPGIALPRLRSRPMQLAARMLSWGLDRLAAGVPREANRIRRQYGLPAFSGTVVDFTARVPLYLIPSAPEFDYDRRDLPACVRYIGPCFAEEPPSDPLWEPDARRALIGDRRPRVLVVEETYAKDSQLFRTAAQAFAGSTVELVLLAGRGRDPAQLDLGATARNVSLESWVPPKQAARSADVVVTDGHSETVLAALTCGVPLVVVPRMLEQPQVAWRVASSGAGIRLPARRCTPRRLREAVERVMASERFARNAWRMGAALTSRGGAARAAEFIEEMASGSSPPAAAIWRPISLTISLHHLNVLVKNS
jgi:MGT family glycosyltransferase